ncbi:MAG: aminotransferase class V-fold PLP-dependent enzyme [Spirochaetia bacterium]
MIYLNNAATSYPKPECVRLRAAASLAAPPDEAGRSTRGESEIEGCRRHGAAFFNAPAPEKFIFTSGATFALNMAIRGLHRGKKNRFITTETEHNSVLRPLYHLKEERGIHIDFMTCDREGRINPGDIKKLITPETAGAVITHGSNVTGAVHDIRELSRYTRAADIPLVVDAAQTAGLIPVDMRDLGIDILVFTGHKYLFGTSGTGGLILGENIDLPPLITGGTGSMSQSLLQPSFYPVLLEAGTPNETGIKSLDSGLSYIESIGFDEIMRRSRELRRQLIAGLSRISGVSIHAPAPSDPGTVLPLLSITISDGLGSDPAEAGYILHKSYEIVVRTGLHCAPLIHRRLGTHPAGTVRVSPGIFTNSGEIETFIKAVSAIAAG